MQTQKEFFAKVMEEEIAATERVLEAVIAEKKDYTPHEKSRTAESLFSQIAVQPEAMLEVLKSGKPGFNAHMAEVGKLSPKDAAAEFAKSANALIAAAKEATDEAWMDKAVLEMDGKVAWETSRGEMIWGFLFDLIHHRGQLSAYLRPMGGMVPAIYGPSADSK